MVGLTCPRAGPIPSAVSVKGLQMSFTCTISRLYPQECGGPRPVSRGSSEPNLGFLEEEGIRPRDCSASLANAGFTTLGPLVSGASV